MELKKARSTRSLHSSFRETNLLDNPEKILRAKLYQFVSFTSTYKDEGDYLQEWKMSRKFGDILQMMKWMRTVNQRYFERQK